MRQFLWELKNFWRKGDLVLLLLIVLTSAFGCLVIASTTDHTGSIRYVIVQAAAIVIGIGAYAVVSSINADFIAEHRLVMVAFNTFMLFLLLTPFGTDHDTGNRSWLEFPFLPFDIQPAEFCKITYVVIMASVMSAHQNRLSSLPSVMHMVVHLGLVAGLNWLISGDAGVSLIFVFIFIGMAFAGGVKMGWFIAGGGALVAAFPVIWTQFMTQRQKNRILVLFDPTIDPKGMDERYHSLRSLLSLNGGGLTGQGLFNGNRTQTGALFAQHTDFIFSAIGEEMGYLGCVLVLLMLVAIIARCIHVGVKSPDYLRKMLCFGVASVLIFQMISNVGMCIGVTPVIGLTLPFISYGGSSIVSLYAMLGLVSGVHARPSPVSHERYIHPPIGMGRY
ncbi:MAG: FtsW/RodA/SpoVE family cell cycle protein [Oscillospiraceae bacterium]|nr:FtsW/RodA/SpoVE family cell cycle protein [Oscillospiraceae bacterium]